MDWINNPHADFVVVAYAIAAVVFVGLACVSLCGYHRAVKEWRAVSKNDGNVES